MKKIALFVMALGAAANLLAQPSPRVAPPAASLGSEQKNEKSDYKVVERGPHHRVWERIESVPAPDGGVTEQRHTYQELATGLHFKNERGEWEESKEEIEILPNDAGAIAAKGQHKVIFPVGIKSGIIEMQTPDGQWLRSRVWGLAYFDASSGESVLLAEVKESDGQVVGDNVVVYPDAFTDFRADIRYTYMRSGFEQDVVLRENPPAPEEFGLNSRFTRLQVLTEFVEAATPVKSRGDAGGLVDESLGFGATTIGIGKAFSVSAAGENGEDIPVAKQWERLEGRDFLIEEVQYGEVTEQLRKLPSAGRYEGANLQRRGKGETVLAGLKTLLPKRYVKTTPVPTTPVPEDQPQRMAKAAYHPGSSFVMDYVTVNASLTNYTFKGDMTYHVTGAILLYGTNIMEGNTVIKYNANTYLRIMDKMHWETDAYRPAVLTAKDDNSVGETISGSTGNPTGAYALIGIYFLNPSSAVDIKYTHFRHLNTGVSFSSGGSHIHRVRNCQFWSVSTGVNATTSTVELENLLMHRIASRAVWGSGGVVRGSHLTVHQASSVLNFASSAAFTNSVFVWVTNWPTAFTSVNNATNNDSGTFQTVGGGSHYLAANSPYRNVGNTNLGVSMLADLKRTTTHPPIAYTNLDFTSSTTFSPQAQRDTDVPDLGYHYSPLDYSFGGCTASAHLTFTPGTAVGWFRSASGWMRAGQAIRMNGDVTVAFEGTAAEPTYFVRLNTVQENDRTAGYGHGGIVNFYTPHEPLVRGRFLRCSAMAGEVYGGYFADDYGAIRAQLTHTEFWSGNQVTYGNQISFTNCLMRRVVLGVNNGLSGYHFYMRNCTMIGGTLHINRSSSGTMPVSVRDTAFDRTIFTVNDYYGGNATYTDYNFNAYTNTTNPFPIGGGNDQQGVTFNWQSSSLGNYYLLSGSDLIDAGSITADAAGLYQFTTQTNQLKEGNSQVDIGYHYVAVLPQGAGAQAVFIAADNSSQGSWKTVYGADGYNVIQNTVNYPAYASVSTSGKSDFTWTGTTSNVRALEKAASSDRIAACWYSGTDFTVSLNLTDGRYHRVAFYCLDWDGNNGRAQTIEIRDASSGVLLDSRTVSSFSDGRYMIWDIKGNVNVKFIRTGIYNAVLNGIFFDPTDQFYIDTDRDGTPDYLEDGNGDGNGGNDPTSWLIYNSLNGLSSGNGLRVFTPLK